jgi:hypothetical protein
MSWPHGAEEDRLNARRNGLARERGLSYPIVIACTDAVFGRGRVRVARNLAGQPYAQAQHDSNQRRGDEYGAEEKRSMWICQDVTVLWSDVY